MASFNDFKADVQFLFPIKFTDTLIYSEEPLDIDGILNRALKYVLSKFEKIETTEIVGSQVVSRAASILKCVTSANVINSQSISVWNTMNIPDNHIGRVQHYFTPTNKMLRLYPGDASVWVEYVCDPSVLLVTDLDADWYEVAVKYAIALLKIKEGQMGTAASLTVLPFEFNYAELRDTGQQERDKLEEDMVDRSAGTLAIRVN